MALPVQFDQDPDGPDGAGLFKFDSGDELYAYEPELAQSVRAKLEAVPDQRTAQLVEPTVPGSTKDQELSDALATQAFQFGAAPNDTIRRVPEPDGPIQPKNAPPPPGTPPVPGADGMQQFSLGSAEQQQPSAPVAPERVYVPGRDPRREAATAVAVPKSQTVTTESSGRAEFYQDDAEARADANIAVAQAKLAEYGAVKETAELQAAKARAQLPKLMWEEAQNRNELERKEQAFKEERAKAQVYVDAARNKTVDPRRFYREKSTATNIGLVIGQALGAFSASFVGGRNWAMDAVQQAQQQDIAAQENALARGDIAADNMLARITDELGGDVEQAKTALKLAHLNLVDAQLQEYTGLQQSAEVQRAAQLWLAENAQARLIEEQKFRDAAIGKQTVTENASMVAPSAGGYREPTLKEQAEQAKYRAEIRKYTNEATGNEPADPKAVASYAKGRQGAEDLLGQVSDVVSITGGKIENGKVKLGEGSPIIGIPGVGPIESRLPTLGKGADVRQTLNFLASSVVKDRSGAAVTDVERAYLMKIVEGGAKTESELQRGLQIIHNYADRKKRNIEASAPAVVRRTYKQQGREAIQEEYESTDDSDVERY